jgi:hypothetical protein
MAARVFPVYQGTANTLCHRLILDGVYFGPAAIIIHMDHIKINCIIVINQRNERDK